MRKSIFLLFASVCWIIGCSEDIREKSQVEGDMTAQSADPIRLGWQIPWATQGQLVMGLKHSNITELTNTSLEYSGFAYGAPLNQAALAGHIDILLTADQPALVLMNRDPSFKIVSRMMYNRVCLYVPPNSSIRTVGDLQGQRVSGPVGAAAERVALKTLSDARIDLEDITFGNLGMAQQSALLERHGANAKSWKDVDALYGFDPLPAIFEEKGFSRMLECGPVVSVVVARGEMLTKRREELDNFITAFKLSWRLFADQPDKMNRIFASESRLEASNSVLNAAASIEPNRQATDFDSIRLTFSPDDLEVIKSANHFLHERGIIQKTVPLDTQINLSAAHDADDDNRLNQLFRQVIVSAPQRSTLEGE